MSRPRVKVSLGTVAKLRAVNKAIAARAGGKQCEPKITADRFGRRACSTCGAKASTAKIIMLCARTGRLPGIKA